MADSLLPLKAVGLVVQTPPRRLAMRDQYKHRDKDGETETPTPPDQASRQA